MIKYFKCFKIFIWSLIHGVKLDQVKQLVRCQLDLERMPIDEGSYRDYMNNFLNPEVKNEK